MEQDNTQIRNLIESAKALLTGISINYNSEIGPRTKQLVEISNKSASIVKEKYPEIANILMNATSHIINRQVVSLAPYGPVVNKDLINAYSFGDIRTSIKILDVLYSKDLAIDKNGRKIFISHSSEDEVIINAFVEKILRLGCGFKRTDIFCTLDHTAIRTGDDFRNEIIKNMKDCDYILCMISDNYRKSEVCQNEMGAAWAMEGKRILPFKFPNVKFTEIGFLNVVKQAADITDKSKLDELYEEFCISYNVQTDWKNYNNQKEEFVKLVSKYK